MISFWGEHGVGYMEWWKVVVTEKDRVKPLMGTSKRGQASHCRLCYASQTTEVDNQLSPQRRLSVLGVPNDVRAPREFS